MMTIYDGLGCTAFLGGECTSLVAILRDGPGERGVVSWESAPHTFSHVYATLPGRRISNRLFIRLVTGCGFYRFGGVFPMLRRLHCCARLRMGQ